MHSTLHCSREGKPLRVELNQRGLTGPRDAVLQFNKTLPHALFHVRLSARAAAVLSTHLPPHMLA